MANEKRLRGKARNFLDDGAGWQIGKISVEQADLVPGIEQRATDGEHSERRQMLLGNTAADGGVRRVEQQNAHDFSRADKEG